MFHRHLVIALLSVFALAIAVPSSARATPPTIALVDVEKILSEAKAAQSLQKQIQAKKDAFQKEFAEKEKQLKTTEDSLLGQKEKLSAEEFGKKRKEYEEKVIDARKLFQKRRSSLDDGLAKAMNELRKNIVDSATKVAEKKGYDIVLTRDSVLIAEKSLDITPDVLSTLNAQLSDIKLQVE